MGAFLETAITFFLTVEDGSGRALIYLLSAPILICPLINWACDRRACRR